MCDFSWDVEVLYCKQMYKEVGAEEVHRERVDRRRGYVMIFTFLRLKFIPFTSTRPPPLLTFKP